MAAKRDPHECRGAGQVPHNHQLTLLNAAAARAVLDPVADPVDVNVLLFLFLPQVWFISPLEGASAISQCVL